jgi:hypothetical protein
VAHLTSRCPTWTYGTFPNRPQHQRLHSEQQTKCWPEVHFFATSQAVVVLFVLASCHLVGSRPLADLWLFLAPKECIQQYQEVLIICQRHAVPTMSSLCVSWSTVVFLIGCLLLSQWPGCHSSPAARPPANSMGRSS